jgi:hypothetical protein
VGDSSNGLLMSDGPSPLLVVVATVC